MHLLSSLRHPLALVFAMQGAPGNGAPPAAPLPEPSAATVAVMAAGCFSCHGPDGRSTTVIPSLAGQSEQRLLQRLQAFKSGTAPDANIMTRLIKGYDEAQIQALARWFAQVK